MIERALAQAVLAVVCMLLACVSTTLASEVGRAQSIEVRVTEVERLAISRHWRDSEAAIVALESEFDQLSAEQRLRLEYVRARNLALVGDYSRSQSRLHALLSEKLSPGLRTQVITTAISVAANRGDWQQAFIWLNEGLADVDHDNVSSAGLHGAASFIYSLVGEPERALELARTAVSLIETDPDPRHLCRALSDLSLAEERSGMDRLAEVSRARQIEACRAAEDPVFLANAISGAGRVALRQGRIDDALRWAEQAIAAASNSGFQGGVWTSKRLMAEVLLASNDPSGEAENLLRDTIQHRRDQSAAYEVAELHQLLARALELRGAHVEANAQLRHALDARDVADQEARERRLVYLRSQFDSVLKEERIKRLEAQKEVASLELAATDRWRVMLAFGVLAMLVIAGLLTGLLRRSMRERRRYRWLSERDGLTRLLNYQRLRQLGEHAFDRFSVTGRPLTAVVADIDLFKQINDRHGHAAGDAVLRMLGSWISEAVGDRGEAGRSGGEEFTLLLDMNGEEARLLVERLRAAIRPVEVFDASVAFTLSFGIAEAGPHTGDLEQLLREADMALYQAKRLGRNCVMVSGQTAEAEQVSIEHEDDRQGSLVVVGCGIQFGRHISERAVSEIQCADVVFTLADAFSSNCIRDIRPDAIDLCRHYGEGKDRRLTYREMEADIMAEVHAGRRVCTVFYGHPGVFADVPHRAIRLTREAGLDARMEPGVSAEACLYADLGIDPGRTGVQSMESTWFLITEVALEPKSLVLLWQVALTGDLECRRFHAEPEGLRKLVIKLLRWYPPDHPVILYEAARLPFEQFRADRLRLIDLPHAEFKEYTTLVLLPLAPRPHAVQAVEDAVGAVANGRAGVSSAGTAAMPEHAETAQVARSALSSDLDQR